jgi:hypothetical protein
MRRSFTLISFLVALLVVSNAYGQSQEDPDEISYFHLDRPFQVISAIRLDGDFLAFGLRIFMRFTDKFPSAQYTAGHRLDTYVRHVRAISNKKIVAAGRDSDLRQISIFLTTPGKHSVPIEKIRRLRDESTYELQVNRSGQPVLLSGTSRRNNTLTVFSRDLRKVVGFIKFGFGQSADLLIKSDGNYAVVGFDSIDGLKGVVPTYWEFTPDLEQVTKERLGTMTKRRGLRSAMMELVSFEGSVYAAYGWDVSGVKDEKPDEVKVRKIADTGDSWNKDQELPYYPRMRFFMSNDGAPYILYPRVDNIYKVSFDPIDGQATTTILNRPSDPVQCFPPKWKYDIVDVFLAEDGNTYIVINGNPLNHPEAGCVTIGLMPS